MQLPGLVLQALAHALDYLRPFGLEAVLKLGAAFRPFSSKREMQLSPNALRSATRMCAISALLYLLRRMHLIVAGISIDHEGGKRIYLPRKPSLCISVELEHVWATS